MASTVGQDNAIGTKAAGLDTVAKVAIELFIERGYTGTSMDQIAKRLGVTKAALYYHAPHGKQQILEHAMRMTMDPLWDSLQRQPAEGSTALEHLQHALTSQVDLIIAGMPEISFFLLPLTHHPLQDEARKRRRRYDRALRALFLAAAEDRSIRTDVDVATMQRSVMAMIYSLHEWYTPGGRLSPQQIKDNVLKLANAAIAPIGD